MKTAELTIEGMSCGHCVMSVRKNLAGVPGVEVEDVRIGSAKIRFDAARVAYEQLNRAVENAGYRIVAVQ